MCIEEYISAEARCQEDTDGDEGTRTPDLRLAKAPLSQLSYIPTCRASRTVGLRRLEHLTSRLSGVRSNQLSYRPIKLRLAP